MKSQTRKVFKQLIQHSVGVGLYVGIPVYTPTSDNRVEAVEADSQGTKEVSSSAVEKGIRDAH